MFIASFRVPINAGDWFMAPLCRYVMSDSMYNKIAEQLGDKDKDKWYNGWSSFNSYERRYGGQDLNGRRLAIYRESGFGDNMIVSGVTHYLKTQYPDCQIEVYGLPHVQPAWMHNKDVCMLPICPAFDAIRTYDYHIMLEGMIENDTEPDQNNAYDNLFDFCGIYSKQVPWEFKRPHLVWGSTDEENAKKWKEIKPWKYILWHWCPSGTNRMYPPDKSQEAILALAEHCHVVICGNTEGKVPGPQIEHCNVTNMVGKTPGWREVLPMIRDARLVVAPDSSILHAAGAFSVPCIGLWGSFHPDDRAMYYENHYPVQAFHSCPKSPCRSQKSDLPRHFCAQSNGYVEGQTWCQAMNSIKPETIIERALKIGV